MAAGSVLTTTPVARVDLTSDVICPDECRPPLALFDRAPLLPPTPLDNICARLLAPPPRELCLSPPLKSFFHASPLFPSLPGIWNILKNERERGRGREDEEISEEEEGWSLEKVGEEAISLYNKIFEGISQTDLDEG